MTVFSIAPMPLMPGEKAKDLSQVKPVVVPPLPGYTWPPAATDINQLFDELSYALMAPEANQPMLLDYIKHELQGLLIPQNKHFSSIGIRHGCTGPLCSHWRADGVREAKRYRLLEYGDARGVRVGGRQPGTAVRLRETTRAAVIYLLWTGRKPSTGLIESLHVDELPIPNTPQFAAAYQLWTAKNRKFLTKLLGITGSTRP